MRPSPLLLPLAAILLSSCSLGGGPAVTEAERQQAAELHPQLLAEFGGVYEGDEGPYVRAIGERVAAAAGLEGQCTFTLVNSDVTNAFAVPGCYIYVTRGLLGIVNSEAELASVLAHEVGHIVGKHAQRRQQRSLWRSLGVAAVGLLTGSEQLTRLAGAAAGYFTLSYSRAQEYQADDLGLKFLVDSGYDPHASSDLLAALGRQEGFLARTRGIDEARAIPEWARTHPLTASRVTRAERAAVAVGPRGRLPEFEERYLRVLDGMLYGDDPEQGFVSGRTFAHPVMRIAFQAPPGFVLTNSPQAIAIEGPDGIRGEFSGAPATPGGLAAHSEAVLTAVLRGLPPPADVRSAPGPVNGIETLVTQALVRTPEGAVTLNLAAYSAGPQIYHFLVVTGADPQAAVRLEPLFASFRLLSAAEAASLRPRVIDIVAAPAGASLDRIAPAMAADNGRDLFLLLNGRDADQAIRPGQLLKIVRYAD